MPPPDQPILLLQTVYDILGYNEGDLLQAASNPDGETDVNEWVNKGEWLALAKNVGVEKIFLVETNPVIVFAQHDDAEPEERIPFPLVTRELNGLC